MKKELPSGTALPLGQTPHRGAGSAEIGRGIVGHDDGGTGEIAEKRAPVPPRAVPHSVTTQFD